MFWPKIAGMIQNGAHVVDYLTMGGIFEQGSSPDSIFSRGHWKGESMAMRVRF